MKVLIFSIIARLIVILGVLGFTFAMYYVTHNLNMLWLLWLILSVMFIPRYDYSSEGGKKETINDKD